MIEVMSCMIIFLYLLNNISIVNEQYTSLRNRGRARDVFVGRILKKERRRRTYKKTLWMQPELVPGIRAEYFERVVPLYTDVRFIKKFRISRKTYAFLCDRLHHRLFKKNTIFRDAIPVGKRILVAITALKSNCDLWSIGDIFGIGKSTVGHILREFCLALYNELYNEMVKFPTSPSDMKKTADNFEKLWQFPGCLGCLDGTHIPIRAPAKNKTDYYNYKHFYSLVLMGVVDFNYRFTYTNIGSPGRMSDATVLRKCNLFLIMSKLIPLIYHIICDTIFPLQLWLMKPFIRVEKETGRKNMDPIENNFNFRLSRARMAVECAFGRLKGRWRILQKTMDFDLENCKLIITACIILHNLCETNKDLYFKKWTPKEPKDSIFPPELSEAQESRLATSKRNYLAKKLFKDRYKFIRS